MQGRGANSHPHPIPTTGGKLKTHPHPATKTSSKQVNATQGSRTYPIVWPKLLSLEQKRTQPLYTESIQKKHLHNI